MLSDNQACKNNYRFLLIIGNVINVTKNIAFIEIITSLSNAVKLIKRIRIFFVKNKLNFLNEEICCWINYRFDRN